MNYKIKATMRKHLFVIIYWILALSFVISSSQVMSQELAIYETSDYSYLDPYSGYGPAWNRLVSLYCRPLYQFLYHSRTIQGVYRRQIAESFSKDKNGLRIKISDSAWFYFYDYSESRNGILDSVRVKANDIVTSYKNLVDKQSELFEKRVRDRLNMYIKDIKKINDMEVHIIFKNGRVPYQPKSILNFPIVPQKGVPLGHVKFHPTQSDPMTQYRKLPWASGPFALKEIKERRGNKVYSFDRVAPIEPNRYRSINIHIKPFIIIKSILSSPQDMTLCVPQVPLKMRNSINQRLEIQPLKMPIVHEVVFNTKHPHLNDVHVRQALSMYLDRKELANRLNSEVDIIGGPFPFGFWYTCSGCNFPYVKYNTVKADKLLEQSGWSKQDGFWKKGGQYLEIKITGYVGSQGSSISQIVESIKNAWVKAGIKAQAVFLTPIQYKEALENRDFDATFLKVEYSRLPYVNRHFLAGGEENYSGLNNTKIERLWRQLLRAPYEEDLVPLWHQLDEEIGNLVPCAFLWTPQTYAAYSEWIKVGQNYPVYNFIGMIEEWSEE